MFFLDNLAGLGNLVAPHYEYQFYFHADIQVYRVIQVREIAHREFTIWKCKWWKKPIPLQSHFMLRRKDGPWWSMNSWLNLLCPLAVCWTLFQVQIQPKALSLKNKKKKQLSPRRLLERHVRLHSCFPITWVMPDCLRLVLQWSWKYFFLPSQTEGCRVRHWAMDLRPATHCPLLWRSSSLGSSKEWRNSILKLPRTSSLP